jgi:hypothetical protein
LSTIQGIGTVVELEREIPMKEEVHSCDLAEIWNDGLRVHDHTHDIKFEEVE